MDLAADLSFSGDSNHSGCNLLSAETFTCGSLRDPPQRAACPSRSFRARITRICLTAVHPLIRHTCSSGIMLMNNFPIWQHWAIPSSQNSAELVKQNRGSRRWANPATSCSFPSPVVFKRMNRNLPLISVSACMAIPMIISKSSATAIHLFSLPYRRSSPTFAPTGISHYIHQSIKPKSQNSGADMPRCFFYHL